MRHALAVQRLAIAIGCALTCANAQAQQTDGGEAATGELPSYAARARIAAPEDDGTRQLPPDATQALSDHLGPSFSFVESMPGAVPVFSGVPYVIVRGAPPSATRTYYDGVSIPTLQHVALMPQVVNRRSVGRLTLHPAVGPARFGRKLGGVFIADARELERGQTLRELELSLLDAAGYLHTPAGDGDVVAAWRVGNPSLALATLGLDARLAYYDYQVSYERQSSRDERVNVMLLGAGDRLGDRQAPDDDIALDFQRARVRYVKTSPRLEVGSELQIGYDRSQLGRELSGAALRIGPQVYVQTTRSGVRTRVGADYAGVLVGFDRDPTVDRVQLDSPTLPRTPDATFDPQDFLLQSPLADVSSRGALGVYGELEAQLAPSVAIELGLRPDVYLAGGRASAALDPSARVSLQVAPALRTHAAVALAHAPVTSPVPLPGLDDIAFDYGVQTAVQSEVGASLALGADTHADATLFLQRYLDAVFLELILDCQGNSDPQAAQEVIAGVANATSICQERNLPRADGTSYGLELYVERELTQRLSGFVAYTLGFANATAEDGTRFTPQADVRHVANAVLQYELGAGFGAGMRLHARTGKVSVNTIFDVPAWRFERVERRLPGFFRADVHLRYRFRGALGPMEARLSWLNVTFAREATKRDCVFGPDFQIVCRVDYQPAIVLPNLSLRGEL